MLYVLLFCFFFFSSRRRHTRLVSDWSSDVCSSDLDKITALEDKITGQPKLEAEYAAGSFEQLYIKALEEEDYRLRLYAAINSLPVDQRRIDRKSVV